MLLRRLLVPPLLPTSPVLRPADVGGPVAFDALVRDGALALLAPGAAVRPGHRVTATDRLVALAHRVPPRTVVGRASAAWVHTGTGPSAPLAVLYPPSCHRPAPSLDLTSHQATLGPDDVAGLGDVRVTTPVRTAVDLALHVPRETAVALLVALARSGRVAPGTAEAALGRRAPGPRTPEAYDVLAEAAHLAARPDAPPRVAARDLEGLPGAAAPLSPRAGGTP